MEERFYHQLGKSIQMWQWVESQLYFLYSATMHGANAHTISVTFNHIQSFDSKLSLLNSCLALTFERNSENWKKWKSIYNKALKLNKKRNKIVHEPVIYGMEDGVKVTYLSPSHFNALALVKGQTSYSGAVITPEYKPSQAKMLDNHKIDINQLMKIETSFKNFSTEIHEFNTIAIPLLKEACKSVQN